MGKIVDNANVSMESVWVSFFIILLTMIIEVTGKILKNYMSGKFLFFVKHFSMFSLLKFVSDSLRDVLYCYTQTIDMTDDSTPFFASSYTGSHLTYDATRYMFPKIFRLQGYTERMETPQTFTPSAIHFAQGVSNRC